MTELQQQETIKNRLSHLKNYIHTIKQQIQMLEKPKNILLYSQISSLPEMIIRSSQQYQNKKKNNQLIQIQKLRNKIKQKEEFIIGDKNKTHRILKSTHHSVPFCVHIYKAKFNLLHSFSNIIKLLSEDDWEQSGIYIGQMCFIVISMNNFQVTKIKFAQIITKTIQIHQNYLQFKAQSSNLVNNSTMIILKFRNSNDVMLWYNFIIHLSQAKKHQQNPRIKWLNTQIKCKQLQVSNNSLNENIDKQQKKYFTLNKNLLTNNQKFITEPNIPKKGYRKYSTNTNLVSYSNNNNNNNFMSKKIINKESQKSSSFFISNSSDKAVNNNNNNNSIQIDMIKIKQEDQLTQSVKFQNLPLNKSKMLEKSKSKDQNNELEIFFKQKSHVMNLDLNLNKGIINVPNLAQSTHSSCFDTLKNQQSPKLKKQIQLLMTKKVMTKLQQKRKLLADSSLTKLNIHWHDDTQQKNSFHHHEQSQSPEKHPQFEQSKQISLFKKKQSLSLKKNSQPYTRRDSNDSPNRFMRVQSATNDKSNDDSNSLADERKRKKTDFSLQHDKYDLSSQRRRNKNEIRDHYMNKLVQKQTIREMSKSSSNKDDSSSRKQFGNLIPIPQKLFSKAMFQPSNRSRQNTNQSEDQSYYQTQTSKQSTQQQIQVQQLKNGIVLQKCSKDAWKAKQKKLYLSNTMAQICYCDIQNPLQQKRFFLKDIKSIQYGKASRGILKHKKRYDQSRCLLIRINRDGKQKTIQFYLQDSQPVYNLQQFTKKLQNFIQKQSQQEQNYEN